MSNLDNLLASREMVLVAGSGGVGKTTIAAAMGIAAAQRQRGKILVLTVDPARRLAAALGLEEVGNTPVRIMPAVFKQAGVEGSRPTVGRNARHEGGVGRTDSSPRA